MVRQRALALGILFGGALLGVNAAPAFSRVAVADAPVADAAMKRDHARLRLLLKQGADVNAAQGDGMTALHWAA